MSSVFCQSNVAVVGFYFYFHRDSSRRIIVKVAGELPEEDTPRAVCSHLISTIRQSVKSTQEPSEMHKINLRVPKQGKAMVEPGRGKEWLATWDSAREGGIKQGALTA